MEKLNKITDHFYDAKCIAVIYGLVDPVSGCVRYVGKSNNPRSRYSAHIRDARPHVAKTPKDLWVQSVLSEGRRPILVTLERVLRTEDESKERWWIKKFRDCDVGLLNISDGGGGHRYGECRPETRKKLSKAIKGIKRSDETRNLISESRAGRRWTSLQRVRIMAGRMKAGPGAMKRNVSGERNPRCKLTPEQVNEVRNWKKGGETLKDLAVRFGVSIGTLDAIRSGRNWAK